jgi:hypothetical protein
MVTTANERKESQIHFAALLLEEREAPQSPVFGA